jgi:nucleoside permease NupC
VFVCALQARGSVIATYALCGFGSFLMIGLQLSVYNLFVRGWFSKKKTITN